MNREAAGPERAGRRRKILALAALAAFAGAMALGFVYAGEPMIAFVKQPDLFRQWVCDRGFLGKLAFVGMMAFQIVVAIIPGEPLEIVAGYAFGAWQGCLLCLLGALLGGTAVFLFVRRWGVKVIEVFFPAEKIRGLKVFQDPKKLNLIAFLLFLIPGTPKDVLTYAIGLTPMKLSVWLLVTSVARFPSVISSTLGGDALGERKYAVAIWVFAATLALSALGVFIYKRMNR